MPTIISSSVQPLWRRLVWFVGLWAGGVLTVGAIASVLRWVLNP